MEYLKPDVRAKITLTGREYIYSGYRPAYLIGNYMTTGLTEFIGQNMLEENRTAEGMITFIMPEAHPNSLKIGMKIVFREGARVMGYADILEIYNENLKAK